MSDREPIGYLPCKKCLSIKSIFQGQGKRARFLYAKCGCGVDQRTGETVQANWQQHQSKEDALSQLETLKTPPKPKEEVEESNSKAPWVVAGLLATLGIFKLVRG